MFHLISRLAAPLLSVALATSVAAQDGRTTLVLDGSGSMWGQIDGEAKITIARRALVGLIDGLPADAALGLVAYGHRERGQCRDIETLVEPGSGTREDILAALDDISPKGKTPLSEAVLHAAEGLAFTEERATVILISDGIETCEADPCAVGRRLEETGIDFTAHVIGFDVDGEAAEQLSCLAEATGGTFLTAADAGSLAIALQTVAEAPVADSVSVTFTAVIEGTGEPIGEGLVWTVQEDGTDIAPLQDALDAAPVVDLLPGTYTATVLWTRTEESASAAVTVPTDAAPFTVTLELAAHRPDATVAPPPTAPAGAKVDIEWTGPGAGRDFVSIAEPDAAGGAYETYSYVEGGSPVWVEMPIRPGFYEARYVTADGNRVLATAPVEVVPVPARVAAAATAPAGATIPVEWDGPGYNRDYVTVAKPDGPGNAYVNYTYVGAGSPLKLVMPGEPGSYELRYVADQDGTILARAAIEVIDVSSTIDAPDSADIGNALNVSFTGPRYDGDFLSVARPEDAPGAYVNYTYVGAGSPLNLVMPGEPGFYELRYILAEGPRILVSRPITVTAVAATIDAPEEAMAGSVLRVGWTGPGYDGDFLSVALLEMAPNGYEHYAYLEGPEIGLTMPAEAGTYELRYVLEEDYNVLVSQPITVTEAIATLDAPAEAVRGTHVSVRWTGPDGPGDYVTVARPDAPDTEYEDYAYTRNGAELTLPVPEEPGAYELRYVLSGGQRAIARMPFAATLPSARLAAPPQATAGTTLQIAWQGPGGADDALAIVPVGGDDGAALARVPLSTGNPVAMDLPDAPGAYELLYVQGGTALVRQTITLN
ncbi:VWA domain-containing protein [Loktanella sp. SALINAS62]|uniref:vWA domain-containing protein n=1 Tax=Loktanella sp. SALINAS62 TaxID=2706124 RepID=UPI001B8CEA52|nr:VWA domain-containing protein [Loktanella sp. SALINAS62]MBS1303400.1 VWA domain-containing protein [Loktanella sp. SALINAS62]